MNYYRYNENFEYIGITDTEPTDPLWTNINYVGSFIKPTFINNLWVEGASNEELQIANEYRIKELKTFCYDELLPTDWYFIRKLETGIDIPQNILDERLEIRNKYNNLLGTLSL